MPSQAPRSVGLIVTSDAALAGQLLDACRALDWIGVSVERGEVALEMMEVVAFSLVVVDVAHAPDWLVCRRLVDARRSPVAVIGSCLAADGGESRSVFQMGVAAYACRVCAGGRLHEMLRRTRAGERCIELVDRSVHGPGSRVKLA